jgi:hypothetical protein
MGAMVQRRASFACASGWTTCILTQGKLVSTEAVFEMLDYCEDFTRRDAGLAALKLTMIETLEQDEAFFKTTGRRKSPLLKARVASEMLYDSKLAFDRSENDPTVRYTQIKRSCLELREDFEDHTRWTRTAWPK